MAVLESAAALARLEQLLVDSSEGRGQLALVQGGLACGKTELLYALTQRASASGALVLSATCSRDEGDLQAGLIDQLFQGADLPEQVTARVEELVTPRTVEEGHSGDAPCAVQLPDARVVHEICGILLELARKRPLVIAVDDVQFADSASLQFLLYVLRRMRSARILMVLTEWERPHPGHPAFRAEITRRPYHEIRLGPLSRDDVEHLVTDLLGGHSHPSLASGIHDLTGGNAVLARALVDDFTRADRTHAGTVQDDDSSPVVGFAFGQATLACLHRWGTELLDTARAVAVLGDHADPELIGQLMQVRRYDVDRFLHTLGSAGLLLNGRFRHQVAERVVLGTLSRGERSAMHLRAAELLYESGAEASAVACQLIAADPVMEPWMVPVLRAAADQALARDDVAVAVRCLESALPVVDRGERLALTAALARALWRVNPSAAARYMPALQAAVEQGSLPARDVVTVARWAMWNGDGEAVARSLRAVPGTAALDDARLVVELRLAFQWYYGSERGQFPDSVGGRGAGSDPWNRATNRLAAVWKHREPDVAVDSAEQILQSCQLGDSTLEVISSALLVLVVGNRLDRATWWCEQFIDEAARRGAVTWQAVLSSVRAAITLRQGRIVLAAEQAEHALHMMAPQSWGVLIGYPLSTLVSACTPMGRYEAAAEALRYEVPEAMFGTLDGLRYLHARGHYYLATDRVLAAISDFERCGRLMREWSLDLASMVPWRSDLAEAHLRLGRTASARDLVNQQLAQATATDDRTRGISLRVLAAASDLPQRPALLRRSVEHLEASGDRVELARALKELSQVHQQLGELDRARLLARRATQETKACHSGPQPSCPSPPEPLRPSPPVTAPGRQQRPDGDGPVLSDAQRRVADLAALGHTNQEISRKLYITVSTVEQHLTRVFRKLGVTSREALPLSLTEVP
ncbi:helix-turn-helix transcriptional regulator [Streptomyces meridianus]|uniref:AAA family ATPase n=1 Tax=Streptomyces meridianus TaxID=2938945 RepID=A0ABT0X361_9ACTN|nr:LuxR family transcriptional regulator [Streptomyces meridianus]MCM2576363.1 AAA family ATPase [Streptomyces meridianus]